MPHTQPHTIVASAGLKSAYTAAHGAAWQNSFQSFTGRSHVAPAHCLMMRGDAVDLMLPKEHVHTIPRFGWSHLCLLKQHAAQQQQQ